MRNTLFLFVVFLAGCAPPAPKPNQRQGAVSPSGRYVVQVPVEGERSASEDSDPYVWVVTILDPDGTVLHRDEDSTFAGFFNVYWLWDDSDRLWLYNSDNGKFYFWELTDGNWEKQEWSYKWARENGRDITPPAGLQPDYSK